MKNSFIKLNINFKLICAYLLTLIATVISMTSIVFLLGGEISSYFIYVGLMLSGFIVYLLYKGDCSKKVILFNILFSILIFFLLIFISTLFYDVSWDGNVYHKQMIGLMKNGMNPLYNVKSGDIWTQHYANGSEVWGAVLYSAFNNIEAGKVINLILGFCLFIISNDFIKKFTSKKIISIITSIAFAFNPLILNQFHSYYIDGIVANSLFISIISIIEFIINDFKMNDKKNILLFVCSSIIAINSKFTALLIWGLFLMLLGGYILIINLIRKDYKTLKKFIILGIITFIFAVGVVGSSTYVKNFVQHKNPFYPLMGEGSVDIQTNNEPKSFKNYSNTKKWLYATFSKTYTWYDKNPELKIPFTVSNSELYSIEFPDIRIGGLGVWYSGLLCLSIPTILVCLVTLFKKKRALCIVSFLLLIGILLPIPKLPIVWQARYYPQLYLLPFISIVLLLNCNKTIFKIFVYIIAIASLINSGFMLPQIGSKYMRSREINNQLVELAELSLTENITLSKDNYTFYGTYYNYIDKGIKYTYSKKRLKDGVPLYHGAMYKIVEEVKE